MGLVKWEKVEGIAVLSMTNGENRHNLQFAEEMLQALSDIQKDESVHALILTSSDAKNFSQGVDLQWLIQRKAENDLASMRKFLYRMNDLFKALLLYPVPVIAAINGHAYANGAILSCACDFRFMRSDRGFFCFPEVDIGIPFLPGMIAWVKKAMPYYKFLELKLSGRRATAQELEEHRVIVKACADLDDLMKQSLEFAKSFHKKRGIFGEMKKRMHKEIIDIIENEDPKYIEPLSILVEN